MEEFAKQFMEKECLIYIMNGGSATVEGTVKEVSGGGILILDSAGDKQLINLEYVTRIREVPRNKNGKKKSLVLD